jgi:CubicO group peptidase (beta-lactamase class C family)
VPDPLAKYVPAFADPKVAIEGDGGVELVPAERPITIQDLLRHTSGLTYEFVGAGAVQLMYAEKGLPSTNQTNADQVERLARLPLFSQPGRQWITAARPMCSGGSSRSYTRVLDMLAGGTRDGQRLLARKTIDLMRSDHLGPNVRRGSELLQPDHKFGLGFAVRTEPGMSVMPVPSACISGAALPARRSGSIRPKSFTR